MCLQWCHVRDLLIDNDIPCRRICPDEIRLAQEGQSCKTCVHRRENLCILTKERLPHKGVCCHHNATIRQFESVTLRAGENVPWELLEAHGVDTVHELFDRVDSAPELPVGSLEDGVVLEAQDLSVPLVYGVCSSCWEEALTGMPDVWCKAAEEAWS